MLKRKDFIYSSTYSQVYNPYPRLQSFKNKAISKLKKQSRKATGYDW